MVPPFGSSLTLHLTSQICRAEMLIPSFPVLTLHPGHKIWKAETMASTALKFLWVKQKYHLSVHGLIWNGRFYWGHFSCHSHWLPLSRGLSPFPKDSLWRKPMARYPAWPQMKQWGQLTLFCNKQSLYRPLSAAVSAWGWIVGEQGFSGVTLSIGFTICARCLANIHAEVIYIWGLG